MASPESSPSPPPSSPSEPEVRLRISPAAALLYQQGNQQAQQQKFAEAAALYRQAVADSPFFAEAYNNLANAERILGNMQAAVDGYERCLAIAPQVARVHRNLAATLLAMDRPSDAIGSLERVLELQPDDDETKEMLKLVRAALENPAAQEVMPPSVEAEGLYQAGIEMHAAGNLAEAEKMLVRAVKLDSLHAGAWHLLGVVAYLSRNFTEALEFIERAIQLDPGKSMYYYDMGNARLMQDKYAEAIACFHQALRIEPKFFQAINNLGNALKKSNRANEAEACYREAIALQPDLPILRRNLAVVLLQQQKREEALEACRDLLKIAPDDDKIRYMESFLSGTGRDAAPAEFLVALFDEYADKFEEHLTGSLGYQAPLRMREAVDRVLSGQQVRWNVLDLGCGTGLCGRAFRDMALRMTGVDLSKKMVDHARASGAYDELRVSELHAGLAETEPGVDLILSADVLIYVGPLGPYLAGCRRVLAPGGLVAFSTELEEGDSYTIRPTGRFTHSEAYVRGVAEAEQFDVLVCDAITCRKEAGEPVAGQVFVLRKR